MKYLLPSFALLLLACSYEFGSAGGAGPTTTSGTGGSDVVVTTNANASVTQGPTSTSPSAVASTVGSASTGLPDELPPCGDFVDLFDDDLDPTRWSVNAVNGSVTTSGRLNLDVRDEMGAYAIADMIAPFTVPCGFTLFLDSPGDDDVWMGVASATGPEVVGMRYVAMESELVPYRDDTLGVPVGVENIDALGMAILDGRVVFLARSDDETWHHVATWEDAPWAASGLPAVGNLARNRNVAVDDYGTLLLLGQDIP